MRKKKALAYLLCTLFLYKVVESTSSRENYSDTISYT